MGDLTLYEAGYGPSKGSSSCASCRFYRESFCRLFESEVVESASCSLWLEAPRPAPLMPEVYACVRVLAEAAGSVPLNLQGTSLRPTRTEQLLRSLGRLVSGAVVDLITEGNAFIRKRRDDNGDVVALSLPDPRLIEDDGVFYVLQGRRLTSRDLIHVTTPYVHRVNRWGVSPLHQLEEAGFDLRTGDPHRVARLLRVPPRLVGLEGENVSEEAFYRWSLRPWLEPIERALEADEDLFPMGAGLSPRFQGPIVTPEVQVKEDDHSEILAALLEISRREQPSITVEAPQVKVTTPPVYVDIQQGQMEKRVERDEEGNIIRVVEERIRTFDRDDEGQVVRVREG